MPVELWQRKCASKSEALLSLSQQLVAIQSQRDHLEETDKDLRKRLVQLEQAYCALSEEHAKFQSDSTKEKDLFTKDNKRLKHDGERLTADNRSLQAEVKDIRSECKAPRQKLARFEVDQLYKTEAANNNSSSSKYADSIHGEGATSSNDYSLLETFEKVNSQNSHLQQDVQSLLYEKEQLVCDRDELNNKVQRLSQELSYLLNGHPDRIVDDIDGVIAENRYLKARLENAQEETGLTRAALKKYCRMLRDKLKGRSNWTEEEQLTSISEHATFSAYTTEQINRVLGSKSQDLNDGDYRSLSGALVDSCNDKLIALTHQRNANKILGLRVTELEEQLQQRNSQDKSPERLHTRRVTFTSVSIAVQCDGTDQIIGQHLA